MAKTNDLSQLGGLTGYTPKEREPKKENGFYQKKTEENMIRLDIPQILKLNMLELEELRTFMDKFEEFVKQDHVTNLTSGQVRTIYSIIHDTQTPQEMHLKRPELAFVAAKQDSENAKEVIKYFLEILKKTDEGNINNIKDFTASFLKYHKLYGKK
jgi:CRISPR/Cas system CSM-associated protein Csm2 small subunit